MACPFKSEIIIAIMNNILNIWASVFIKQSVKIQSKNSAQGRFHIWPKMPKNDIRWDGSQQNGGK